MNTIALLGSGNIGAALARGLLRSGYDKNRLILADRRQEQCDKLSAEGFNATRSVPEALAAAGIVILAVTPSQVAALAQDIKPYLKPAHRLVSVIATVSTAQLREYLGNNIPVIRAMPNIAAGIAQSMTALSFTDEDAFHAHDIIELFNHIGKTVVIPEERMIAATVLCACSTAFFLRAIRAAAQGGTQIGFHPEQALPIAAQVALGAAELLADGAAHPEIEIDRVTTPQGSTIAGLIEMEYHGFSSALIRGIVTSHEKTKALG